MEKADLLVSVPVQKWSALSFNDADAIIKAGYDAAAAKSKILMGLAVDETTWKRYLADRDARRRKDPVPTFVAVEGVNGHLSQRIEESTADLVGKPINFGQLNKEIMRLKGTERYSALDYQFVERNGQQGLLIKTEARQVGPPVVQPLILIARPGDGTWTEIEQKVVENRAEDRRTTEGIGSGHSAAESQIKVQ
jgi:NTE family protein